MSTASTASNPNAPLVDRAAPEGASRRLVLFRLGDRVYGIDLQSVREILTARRATRLPGSPPYVSGLINVRGTIITVVDLGARLDGQSSASPDGSIILIEHANKVVGVAVNEVRDVQVLATDALETSGPSTAEDGSVRALGRIDDKVVIILDIHAIIRQVLL